MKPRISILLALALALAWSARAQDDSRITREGSYWVRTIRGAINRSPIQTIRVETVGNVVLQGGAASGATFTLTARVQAPDERTAEALLREFEVKTGTVGDQAFLMVRSSRRCFLSCEAT